MTARHGISRRKSPSWIIVADESSADFYSQDKKNSPLHQLFGLKNKAAQSKVENLISDRGGRSFDSHGYGRHTLSTRTDPKEYESLRFADAIATRVVQALQQGNIASYALIAAPRFLGMLRKALNKRSVSKPYLTISKEVVGHNVTAIEQLLSGQ